MNIVANNVVSLPYTKRLCRFIQSDNGCFEKWKTLLTKTCIPHTLNIIHLYLYNDHYRHVRNHIWWLNIVVLWLKAALVLPADTSITKYGRQDYPISFK